MRLTSLLAVCLVSIVTALPSEAIPAPGNCGRILFVSSGNVVDPPPLPLVKNMPCHQIAEELTPFLWFIDENTDCRCFFHNQRKCVDKVEPVESGNDLKSGIADHIKSFKCFEKHPPII